MSDRRRAEATAGLLELFGEWAIGDDYERDAKVEAASFEELRALVDAVDKLPESVWQWLAGPESESLTPSEEYIATSDVVMAAELARIIVSGS